MLTRLSTPEAAARWLRAGVSGRLRTDSRRVRPGDGFIAWPGHAVDGRRFVADALEAGAASVLVEAEGVEAYGFADARIGALSQLKAYTGPIADAYFEHPSRRLRVVATTGTNGKTSTAWWTAQALTLLGRRCGLVGTLGIGEPPQVDGVVANTVFDGGIEPTGLTTPDPVALQAGLRRMVDAGFAACAIEASSIGLVEHRLAATRIAVALFTNFTRDHLDFHGSMVAYWAAKRALFDWPGLEAAVVNLDDAQGAALAAELQAGRAMSAAADPGPGPDAKPQASGADSHPALWTYSLHDASARLHAEGLRHVQGGMTFTVHEGMGSGMGSATGADAASSARSASVRSALVGDYNAANLLAVIGGLRALGIDLDDAAAAVSRLMPVPGRLQRMSLGADAIEGGAGPEVVVDYAHTPDALEKVLTALRPLAQVRGGRLVCVFGCGGNRDASKRPLMAAAAERLADSVVVTSDNPRHEDPDAIFADILAGFLRPEAVKLTPDRRHAIAEAVLSADPRDLLLIAGKGHEDYQEIAGVKHLFSDADEAIEALSLRAKALEAGTVESASPAAERAVTDPASAPVIKAVAP